LTTPDINNIILQEGYQIVNADIRKRERIRKYNGNKEEHEEMKKMKRKGTLLTRTAIAKR